MSVRALSFYPLRFNFRAIDPVHFPEGKSGNILRGAFGLIFKRIADPACYARIFEPTAAMAPASPSGLANWPRPFVLRASHLDGRHIQPGEQFHFNVNLFDLQPASISYFAPAFAELATEGLGPGRGRAELIDSPVPHQTNLDLTPLTDPVERAVVEFLTPTELKSDDGLAPRPEFGVLFARIRDRVSTLSALYGEGPLDIDFKALGERAAHIHMSRCNIEHQAITRRSSRTGQTHPIGGFTGIAHYDGDLSEFVPFLRAGVYTGVGRQTTWGKGWMRVAVYP